MGEPTPGSKPTLKLPRLRLPKLTPKRATFTAGTMASTLFTLAIWTGDQRFGQTGIIPVVVCVVAAVCWLGSLG